jgi:hypothetical protein
MQSRRTANRGRNQSWGCTSTKILRTTTSSSPTPSWPTCLSTRTRRARPFKAAGTCLLESGDGLRWKLVGGFNKPTYANPKEGDFTDSHAFAPDTLAGGYRAYVRTFAQSHVAEKKDGRRRAIGISTCKALNRDWTPIVNVLAADDQDDAKVAALGKDKTKPDWAELYCMHFFPYGNHYVGLLSLLYFVDGKDTSGGGDLQLTFSHDGTKWFRQPERATLIAPSKSQGLFPTYATTNEPLEIGDELWLYYSEANGAHPIAPFEKAISQIRAAVWRKDGLVSLDAADKATLVTKPLLLERRQLQLNVKIAEGGAARAAILNESGKPLPGLDLNDCDPLRGDKVRGVVSWKGKSDLASLRGKTIRLKIELSRGSLFSFRVAGE